MTSLPRLRETGRFSGTARGAPARSRAMLLVVAVLGMSFMSMGTPDQAVGQLRHEEPIGIYGHVQWIAGTRIVLDKDCRALRPCDSIAGIVVDLREVPQSVYRGITQGMWVFVEGFVQHDNASHRFFGISIRRVEEWEGP